MEMEDERTWMGFHLIFFLLSFNILKNFIYLAVLSLNCGTRDLRCIMQDL